MKYRLSSITVFSCTAYCLIIEKGNKKYYIDLCDNLYVYSVKYIN